MKKTALFLTIALFFTSLALVSCGDGGAAEKEKARLDSIRTADSLANEQRIADSIAAENERQQFIADSIAREDSMKNAKKGGKPAPKGNTGTNKTNTTTTTTTTTQPANTSGKGVDVKPADTKKVDVKKDDKGKKINVK